MKVMDFATSQKMELNLKKCKEMQSDFRQNRTVIPPLTFNDTTLERVSAFKLLGLWIDDNLKWQTNTDYIIGKAVKRLFLLKILKKYGADKIDMKRFYISAIRPTLEYGAQVWHGGPTKAQSSSIKKVQRRALRIIYSEKDYEKLLLKAGMHTLEQRRNTMCIDLTVKCLTRNTNCTIFFLINFARYGKGYTSEWSVVLQLPLQNRTFSEQSNCFVN